MEGIQPRKEYKLDHYQQQDTWDCGLACIVMILPALVRQLFLDNYKKICEEGGFERSTWTIDLCYILRGLNIRHVYLTKLIGIDPAYYNQSYYINVITKDEQRVMHKLRQAEKNGITILQKTVAIEELVMHLAKNGPIILLTNSAFLGCDVCKKSVGTRRAEYSGHYIVLCGYDLLRGQIFYKNPGTNNHTCITSFSVIDQARKAFGTDQDITRIKKSQFKRNLKQKAATVSSTVQLEVAEVH